MNSKASTKMVGLIGKLVQQLPFVNIVEQEKLMKAHVIEYFEKEVFV